MPKKWNCWLHHQEYGPLTKPQLREMAEQGQLVPGSLVRPASGDAPWQEARILNVFDESPSAQVAEDGRSDNGQQGETPVVELGMGPASTSTVSPGDAAQEAMSRQRAHKTAAVTDTVLLQPQATPVPVNPVPVTAVPVDQVTADAVQVQPDIVPVPAANSASAPAGAEPAAMPAQPTPAVQPAVQSAGIETTSPFVGAGQPSTGAAPGGVAHSADEEEEDKTESASLAWFWGLIGTACVVLIGGIAAISLRHNGDDTPPEPEQAVSQPAEPQAPAVNVETDPELANSPSSASEAAPAGDSKVQRALKLASQVRWFKSGLLLKGVASLKLASAWLEPPTDTLPARLMVEVRLTNHSGQALEFSSWHGNGPVGDAAAMLLVRRGDAEPQLLELLPDTSAQPSYTLADNEQVTEQLAFAAPPDDFDVLRLMLPKQAIGRTTAPFGFEIQSPAVKAGTRPPAADVPAALPDSPPTAPDPSAASGAASPTPEPAGPQQPSIEEITRAIQDMKKREQNQSPPDGPQ